MIDWLEDDAGIAWLRRAILFVLACGALAFIARGADRPADPFLKAPGPAVTTTTPAPAPSVLPGG